MSKESRSLKFEIVTPEIAKRYLEKNTHNRNRKEKTVDHYVRLIEEGQWVTNGDTIRFDWSGKLIDGQHRLMAIIETGQKQECIIVRGLDPAVMSTIDTGRPRTLADHIKLQHRFEVSNFNALAAAVSICGRFHKGTYVETRERLSAAEAIAFLEQNPGIIKSHDATIGKGELARLIPPSVALACHYLFSKIDRFKTEEFFEKLITGAELGKTSPILKLRTQIASMRGGIQRRGALSQRTYLYYMVAAFEAYVRSARIDGFPKMTADSVIELPKKLSEVKRAA